MEHVEALARRQTNHPTDERHVDAVVGRLVARRSLRLHYTDVSGGRAGFSGQVTENHYNLNSNNKGNSDDNAVSDAWEPLRPCSPKTKPVENPEDIIFDAKKQKTQTKTNEYDIFEALPKDGPLQLPPDADSWPDYIKVPFDRQYSWSAKFIDYDSMNIQCRYSVETYYHNMSCARVVLSASVHWARFDWASTDFYVTLRRVLEAEVSKCVAKDRTRERRPMTGPLRPARPIRRKPRDD